MMRDYMKALCCRFETTSRRAEYLDRKVERTYRQLTRLLDEPERKLLLKMALCGRKRVSTASSPVTVWPRVSNRSCWQTQSPYNFENEDEQRACELARKER